MRGLSGPGLAVPRLCCDGARAVRTPKSSCDMTRPNTRLQRMRMRAPLSRKPFGAAVKIRAGRRRVAARGSAQPRPCVYRLIPASPAGPVGSTHALAP